MRILIVVILSLFIVLVQAQQDIMVTQFTMNQQSYNPAYSSVKKHINITGIFRDQWSGLDGAPSTQLLSFSAPLQKQNIGLGLTLTNESVGIQKRFSLISNYSYKLRFTKSTLHIGVGFSYRSLTNDFTDPRLLAIDGFENDPSIQRVKEQFGLINFGLGLYYEMGDYFIGASIPRILKNRLSKQNNVNQFSTEVWHGYLVAGKKFDLNPSLFVTPQVLVKFAEQSPVDLDLQIRALFQKFFDLGVNYRLGGGTGSLGESMSIMFGLHISDAAHFGVSYDIPLSEFRNIQGGSIEFFVSYDFGKNNLAKEIINPRYF